MLTYRISTILFIAVIGGMIVADFFLAVSVIWYMLIVFAWFGLLVTGSIHMPLQFYVKSISSGNRTKRQVAFSFDDGPDPVNTPQVLDILKKHNIKAVFFAVGKRVTENGSLVRRIDEEGHLLGGHSYSHHFFFDLMPWKRIKIELEQTADSIRRVTGKKPHWFRPPYGVTNPMVGRAIRKVGCQAVGWSLKSRDTVIGDENFLLKRLKEKVQPGDLILFHDPMPILQKTLPVFIAYLREQHFEVVRPDELLNTRAYEL